MLLDTIEKALKLCSKNSTDSFVGTEYFTQNIHLLAKSLAKYYSSGIPETREPYFKDENTPNLRESFEFFRETIHHLVSDQNPDAGRLCHDLEKADIKHILTIAGMRMTQGSLLDVRAFPPKREQLLGSANKIHKEKLTVAAKAWSKHAWRNPEFWGQVKGKIPEKNAYAENLVKAIIDKHTWWNTYGHFKHEYVFEMRLSTGHGARWSTGDGTTFIGFVEPVDSHSGIVFETDKKEV